jgi:hypothetical protein
MKDLTGASGSFVAQRSLETGDELNEANIEEALQAAADRAQYLKSHVDGLETGIKTVRKFSSAALLKGLTGMAADDVAMVTSVSTFGIYKFVSAAPAGSDVPAIRYDANDGSGFWINAIYSLVTFTGGASGAATRLNASGLAVPNRIVSITEVAESSPTYLQVASASGSFEDIGLALGALTLEVGDIVLLTASGGMTNETANQYIRGRIAVVNPTPSTAGITGSDLKTNMATAGDEIPMTMTGRFVCSIAGSHTFKVQVQGPSGHDLRMYIDRRIEAIVIRP